MIGVRDILTVARGRLWCVDSQIVADPHRILISSCFENGVRRLVVTRLNIILLVAFCGAMAAVTSPASASESSGKYSKLSNKELTSRALKLVKGIRELVYSYNEKDRDLTTDFDAEYLATRTTERRLLREQWRQKMDEAQRSSVRKYQQNFASDAAMFREELQRRLSRNLQRRDLPKLYSNPENVLALELIADDLELLAKLLPET